MPPSIVATELVPKLSVCGAWKGGDRGEVKGVIYGMFEVVPNNRAPCDTRCCWFAQCESAERTNG